MLQGGKYARPPVSRMGNKHGYGLALLRVMGLRPGQGAERFLWCEPDAGCRALLHAYTDRDVMQQAARIIRSWADEEPRALWERLRAEGPARCSPVDAREVGRFATLATWAFRRGFPDSGPCGPSRWADGEWRTNTGEVGVRKAVGPATIAPHIAACSGLPATIHDDATTLDPREVARWAHLSHQAFRRGDISSGYRDDMAAFERGTRGHPGAPSSEVADRLTVTLPATIHDDATTAPIPDPLPEGTLVFIDPPYVGTTGYAHDLDRPAVVRLAQRWAAAGARVMISEAVPIEALVACGWHAVEITAMRVGQRRTFSKQQREWVTCSFQPDPRAVRACEWAADRAKRAAQALKGGDQIGLFGGAEE